MEFLKRYLNRLQCKLQTEPDLKASSGVQNLQDTWLGFCIKVIQGHHMPSTIFFGIYRIIYEVVVVQLRPLKE